MPHRFYAYRGTVARWRETPEGLEISACDGARWLLTPNLISQMIGTGGDPGLDQVTREVAREIVERRRLEVVPSDVTFDRLDGPGSDVVYGTSGRRSRR